MFYTWYYYIYSLGVWELGTWRILYGCFLVSSLSFFMSNEGSLCQDACEESLMCRCLMQCVLVWVGGKDQKDSWFHSKKHSHYWWRKLFKDMGLLSISYISIFFLSLSSYQGVNRNVILGDFQKFQNNLRPGNNTDMSTWWRHVDDLVAIGTDTYYQLLKEHYRRYICLYQANCIDQSISIARNCIDQSEHSTELYWPITKQRW